MKYEWSGQKKWKKIVKKEMIGEERRDREVDKLEGSR